MSGALYICYFGLREPLVQTQVLPYLRELAKGGERMSLLTFEPQPWPRDEAAQQREQLRADGIAWHWRRYHKRPSLPATLYDIAAGALAAAFIARRERLDILHGRSHVGTAIGALAKKLVRARLVFDIRGLMAEEYADSGNWPEGGVLFRLTKRAERWLMRAADAYVVLTENARRTLFAGGTGGRALEVIPCCVDVDGVILSRRSAAKDPERAGSFAVFAAQDDTLANRFVFVYAGSLGGYYLTAEMAELLAVAREHDPTVFALILTRSDAAPLVRELERSGFTRDDYRVVSAAPEDVSRFLRAAHVGLAVMRPSFARRAMSPTKFAEYLAAGLPVVATAGVGDLDAHIEEGRSGVLLRSHDRAAYAEAFRALLELRRDPSLAERCRQQAREQYDLQAIGGARYRRLYARLREPKVAESRGREVSRSHHPETPRPRDLATSLRVLALASYPVEAAASRHRIVQFVEPLAQRGIDFVFSPFLDAMLFAALYRPSKLAAHLPRLLLRLLRRAGALFSRADAVFVQREAMLVGPPLIEWWWTHVRRRPMVLDLDDPTWIAYTSPVYGRLATVLKWPSKTNRLIDWSRVVTCGSPAIADYVRARGREAVLLPTIVDTRVYTPREEPPREVPIVGWIGTHGTYPFLERLLPIFDELARTLRFELVVIGSGRSIDARPWSLEREPEDFRSLDVGVYPIGEGPWSAAKSGFKAIQYMASGVPFVMSPVGVCATIGIPGETHLHAVTDDDWRDALRRLITDGALRARIGRAGRAYAERHYSIEAHADALAEVIRKAAS